jgi:putative acetyltransferase
MSDKLEIRESVKADAAAIEALYPEAFPDEDLLPLVRDLLQDARIAVSLVGAIDLLIAGHVIFTKCGVVGNNIKAALLGPLAVAPAWQRQGIGSAIVCAGLQRLKDADVPLVCVLGDPAYYGRLGFVPETLVEPPFPLPTEWSGAWQSQNLDDTRVLRAGKLTVPPQWLQPALWAP